MSSTNISDIPPEVRHWSWGAFLLNWVWAIGNRTWIGLFALVPVLGIFVAIILGYKGREWAWRNKHWQSLDHFNQVQKNWSIVGFVLYGATIWLGLIWLASSAAINFYQEHPELHKLFAHAPSVETGTEGNWSALTKGVYIYACAAGLRKNDVMVDKADQVCTCVADHAEKLIPEEHISDKQNSEILKKVAMACVNEAR